MIRHSAKDLEVRLLRLVLRNRHDTRHVPAAVTVVRRAPHRYHVAGVAAVGPREVVLVPFVDELVGAGDEGEVVYVVELEICR